MSRIVLSYAHEDRELAAEFRARLVSGGVQVWWDADITSGDFRQAIQGAIRETDRVVPLWTTASVENSWVLDEVRYAIELQKPVFGVKFDPVAVPVGLGHIQLVDVADKKRSARAMTAGVAAVRTSLGEQTATRRLQVSGNLSLELPCFLRSVSSHETFLRPDMAVSVLEAVGCEALLVSAYDTRTRTVGLGMRRALARIRQAGGLVFLDSGNYEAFRKGDKAWTEQEFLGAARLVPADAIFSFDNTAPSARFSTNVNDVVARVRRAASVVEAPLIPIVHAPRDRQKRVRSDVLPDLCVAVCEKLEPIAIAVPERELGDGLLVRARNVRNIRDALSRLSRYQPLHLLGTGNPLSIAVYAATGADMFDGLEWCRTVADEKTKQLFHFQQFDFFIYQSRVANHPIVRAAVDDPKVSYTTRLAFHNLNVFAEWVRLLREHAAARTIDRLLVEHLPKGAFEELSRAVPEVFQR